MKLSSSPVTAKSVTLAVPCFNAERYLPTTLQKIKALTQAPARVIVVNDGSTDRSAEIAKSHGVEVIDHRSNKGLGAARQTAVTSCVTPWIAMVDSDVAVEPDWLNALLLIASTEGASGVGGDLRETFASSVADRWRARMMPQTHGGSQKSEINLFGCNTLHRVDALQAVGGFNARYTRSYEDMDISERLRAAGHKLFYTPDARCEHLRKDSAQSVLKACFGWRLPRYEEQGVYKNLNTLMAKWILTFREQLQELQMILEEQEGDISIVCLLQLFAEPLQDLAVLATSAQSMQLRAASGIGTAMILVAIKHSLLPEELKQVIGIQVKPFVDIVTAHLSHLALAHEGDESITRVINSTVAPWSQVLSFSPEQNRRMLRSAELIKLD